MTTRYENTDGMDDKISFGDQIVRPPEEEIKNVLKYVIHNNPEATLPNDDQFNYPDSFDVMDRQSAKELLLFIMNNNKHVSMPLQGMVTVSRLRKEK